MLVEGHVGRKPSVKSKAFQSSPSLSLGAPGNRCPVARFPTSKGIRYGVGRASGMYARYQHPLIKEDGRDERRRHINRSCATHWSCNQTCLNRGKWGDFRQPLCAQPPSFLWPRTRRNSIFQRQKLQNPEATSYTASFAIPWLRSTTWSPTASSHTPLLWALFEPGTFIVAIRDGQSDCSLIVNGCAYNHDYRARTAAPNFQQ